MKSMKLEDIQSVRINHSLPEFAAWYQKPLEDKDQDRFSKNSELFACNEKKFRAIFGKANSFTSWCRYYFWVIDFKSSRFLITTSKRGSDYSFVTQIGDQNFTYDPTDAVDFLEHMISKL